MINIKEHKDIHSAFRILLKFIGNKNNVGKQSSQQLQEKEHAITNTQDEKKARNKDDSILPKEIEVVVGALTYMDQPVYN